MTLAIVFYDLGGLRSSHQRQIGLDKRKPGLPEQIIVR